VAPTAGGGYVLSPVGGGLDSGSFTAWRRGSCPIWAHEIEETQPFEGSSMCLALGLPWTLVRLGALGLIDKIQASARRRPVFTGGD